MKWPPFMATCTPTTSVVGVVKLVVDRGRPNLRAKPLSAWERRPSEWRSLHKVEKEWLPALLLFGEFDDHLVWNGNYRLTHSFFLSCDFFSRIL